MSRRYFLLQFAALGTTIAALSACAGLGHQAPANVAAAIAGRPELSTLAGLIDKSGLTPVLSAAGPYTVFAPSNQAFASLPAKALQDLAANPAQLKDLLTHHVVAGRSDSNSITGGNATTALGSKLAVAKAGSFVTVEDALVTQADISAGNGVVHVIDRVLTPPKK